MVESLAVVMLIQEFAFFTLYRIMPYKCHQSLSSIIISQFEAAYPTEGLPEGTAGRAI
jgi:hypothetical protein